jgi:hypothetical protein
MQPTKDSTQVAALRELASRLYRCFEERAGKVYWRQGTPPGLSAWVRDVNNRSPYDVADYYEFYRVLDELCGLILRYADGRADATMQGVVKTVTRNQWSNTDIQDLLRWLEDDPSRVDLVDDHWEEGGILPAIRAARSKYRRSIADFWLAVVTERAAEELAAWPDTGKRQSGKRD